MSILIPMSEFEKLKATHPYFTDLYDNIHIVVNGVDCQVGNYGEYVKEKTDSEDLLGTTETVI